MRKKTKKRLVSALSTLAFLGIVAFAAYGPMQDGNGELSLFDFLESILARLGGNAAFVGDGTLKSFYLDVGQGDSEYIESPNGKTMLIDASEYEYADEIAAFLKDRGVKRIDYAIITHPHSDHYGGMRDIINSFDIGEVYMPDATNNASGFEKLLTTIAQKNIPVTQAMAGVTIDTGSDVKAEFLAPNSSEYEELNDYSAVVKISYGNTSFLYMGDAEKLSENEITGNVKADVVKVGHHGSKTSSGEGFVKRVRPKYAVVSAGADNQYGLPKDEILKRWQSVGANILITYQEGNIAFESDGNEVKRIAP